jgi:AcrR family transcriptional regulator
VRRESPTAVADADKVRAGAVMQAKTPTDPDKITSSADAILDAAEMLFGRRGYASTSIAAICTASALPVGSIYHHFGSKSAVLSAVLDRAGRRFFVELDETVGAHLAPEDRLRKYFEEAPELAARNANFNRIMAASLQQDRDQKLLTFAREAADQAAISLAAIIRPVAEAAGINDPAALSLDLAEMANNYLLGAGILAGYDVQRLRKRMAPLHGLIRAAIDMAASADHAVIRPS